MKKYIALLLMLAFVLVLTACGRDTPAGTTPGDDAALSGEQSAESTGTQEAIPFGDYHSEEELLAMLESGDFSEYLSIDPEVPAEAVDTGGDEPYAGFSNAITFTDGGSAEGVEFTDFMEELSPEQRAEWEEMQEAMSEEGMEEMLDGMEEMTDMEGAEDSEDIDLSEYGDIDLSEFGIELPEGYEQYLP
ncbi:MAG: hypothetical protein E7464_06490 [Ruminococcaceae bacterium]|nr:hypothetical protein [Oscillospiraceae bacterium]